jgi:hypothetical protein
MKTMMAMVSVLAAGAILAFGQGYGNYKGPTAPFRQVIGTTAVKVLPERGNALPAVFTAGRVYRQGDVVRANAMFYMCVSTNSTGTAGTNTPSWVTGEASDGTNTWRAFQGGPRKGWVLYNAGTNTVMMGYGYVPTAATGAAILPGGQSAPVTDTLQDAVYIIGTGTATNGLVTGVEL